MIELGIALAFGVAAIKGIQSVYQRKNALGTDEFVTAWASRAFGIPVLGAAIVYQGIPELTRDFLIYVIPQGIAIALASLLIAKAYKESDASIVTPMFAVSPVLLVGTSFLILGEVPTFRGLTGILLITFGAYTLKIDGSKSLTDPLRKLWEERGVQIILLVVLIYSVTANIDKLGVNASSAVMWPLSIYVLSSTILLPVMMKKSPEWKSKIRTDWKPLSVLGVLGGFAVILQMTAFKLTMVSYVVAIKRLSIPLTIIFSFFMLNETESFRERITGSLLMIIGALLISL
jgi:uncharacterized membrane protein